MGFLRIMVIGCVAGFIAKLQQPRQLFGDDTIGRRRSHSERPSSGKQAVGMA
jgi:hypothetical protein